MTRWAMEAGADPALVVNPYYNKPTQVSNFFLINNSLPQTLLFHLNRQVGQRDSFAFH